MHVQPMQAMNALNVSSWHRGPQPAENDLTVRSTPGQQQDIDSKRAEPESPTCMCAVPCFEIICSPQLAHGTAL